MYIGLDVHKEITHYAMVDDEGTVVVVSIDMLQSGYPYYEK